MWILTLCMIASRSHEGIVFFESSHLVTSPHLPCPGSTDAHWPQLGALVPLLPKWRPFPQVPCTLPSQGPEQYQWSLVHNYWIMAIWFSQTTFCHDGNIHIYAIFFSLLAGEIIYSIENISFFLQTILSQTWSTDTIFFRPNSIFNILQYSYLCFCHFYTVGSVHIILKPAQAIGPPVNNLHLNMFFYKVLKMV